MTVHEFPATLDEMIALYESRGARLRRPSGVTELAHARQAAACAAAGDGGDAAVVAAFFHDLGRLLYPAAPDGLGGATGRHETAGADVLARFFPATVSEPVRLHVAAKRALATLEPGYLARLSEEARRDLVDRLGGAYPAQAAARFLKLPHGRAALDLRRCDDRAHDPKKAGLPLAAVVAAAERMLAPARPRG